MRQLFAVAAIALVLPTAALAVDGTNLPGRDYDDFPAPSAFVCRTTCGGESACQAYTWVKPGIQGPQGHCWLKRELPAIVKDACCDSGPRNFISKRELTGEVGINRPGSDIGSFETMHYWQDCQMACDANTACMTWTYVRPGIQGPKARCWLKNQVVRPVSDKNAVSGVKYRLPSVRFD